MAPDIPYTKLVELWQQNCRAEIVKYQCATGAGQSLRRGQRNQPNLSTAGIRRAAVARLQNARPWFMN
jgi:hypothetical protein